MRLVFPEPFAGIHLEIHLIKQGFVRVAESDLTELKKRHKNWFLD